MDLSQKVNVNLRNGRERNFPPGSPYGFPRGFYPGAKKEDGGSEVGDRSNSVLAKIFDFLIKISILAIFFGIPLFFTGLSFQGIAFEKQTYFYFWILLALIAWGMKSGYVGEMKIKRTPLDIPIVIFWIFYLVATIFSIDRWHSFVGFFGDPSRGLINITAILVLYYIFVSNFNEKLLKWAVRTIIFSGIISVLWQLLKIFNLKLFFPETIWNSLPISTVGSLQSSGIFACFLIVFIMMKILKIQDENISIAKKSIYSIIYVFGIIASFSLVLSLYNYIPMFRIFPLVGLVAGSAFFLIFVLARIVRPKGSWTILPMAVFVFILVLLMVGSVNFSKISLPFNVNIPAKTSIEIAKKSLENNFFLGYGPGNYGYTFSKFLPANFDNMNIRFFEGGGILTESMSTLGAVGTILLLMIILTFLGTNIFLLYRGKEKNKIYSLGIMSAVMVLLANAAVAQTEASILFLLAMIGMLAVGTLLLESDIKEKYFNFSLKASPKFALTLAFISLLIFASVIFLFIFFGKIFVADIFMEKAVRASNANEEGSIANIKKAIELNGKEGRYFTKLGQEYMVLVNSEVMKGEKERDVNKVKRYLDLAAESGKKGKELMPNDVTATEALAQIYENSGLYLSGGFDLAEKEYQRALELEPNNPNFYVKLGQIKKEMANKKDKSDEKKRAIEEARDLFQKALEVRKNSDAAYYNLALAQEYLGQLDEAIDNMTKAVKLQNNNINYVYNLARLFQLRGTDDDNRVAENLFKQILNVNDKEINTHFNLGLLYEKMGKKDEAAGEYEKVLDLLPAGSDTTKKQLEKMIDNIERGIENTPENANIGVSQTSENQEDLSSEQEQDQDQTGENAPIPGLQE